MKKSAKSKPWRASQPGDPSKYGDLQSPVMDAWGTAEDKIQQQTVQTRFVGQCDYLELRWPKPKHRHESPRGIRVRFVNVPFTARVPTE